MGIDPTGIASGAIGGLLHTHMQRLTDKLVKKYRGDDTPETDLSDIAAILLRQTALLESIVDVSSNVDTPDKVYPVRFDSNVGYSILPDNQRPHNSLLIKATFNITIKHPIIGDITKSVAPGWLSLDMPYGTEIRGDTPQLLLIQYSTEKLGVDF